MTDKINVISADKDGADLRREKFKNSYHARCDGRDDNEQIQDSLNHMGKVVFTIPSDKWDRIFGVKA